MATATAATAGALLDGGGDTAKHGGDKGAGRWTYYFGPRCLSSRASRLAAMSVVALLSYDFRLPRFSSFPRSSQIEPVSARLKRVSEILITVLYCELCVFYYFNCIGVILL